MKFSPRFKKRFRVAIISLLSLAVALLLVMLYCNNRVTAAATDKLFNRAGDVPSRPVALVLGCSPKLSDGRENYFFTFRMDAAAELYFQKRAKILLVSGDNRFHNYDEPTEMKKALVSRGVPEKNIVCDYAGRRTLDSVIRAREIFGQNSFIIVSQPFHNTRALYIAGKNGIDAVGYNARDIETRAALRTYLRETLARTKAVLDVEIFNVGPQLLGEPVSLPDL